MPKKTIHPDQSRWDPSLKRTFKHCTEWWESATQSQWLERLLSSMRDDYLSREGLLRPSADGELGSIGHAHGMHACLLAAQGSQSALASSLQWAVAFNALAFRFQAFTSLPATSQPVLHFSASMRVAATLMLAQWHEAETSVRLLIEVAHKDQAMKPEAWRKDGWGKGTHDAFLIYLLAEAFGLSTHYRPASPLIPEYRGLLEAWRTEDEGVYRAAMHAAAEFHLSRSKPATERNDYEFDASFYRVYPAELLAVQALRRREGLPEFQAGHLLVDTPWSILRELPPVEPHPLLVATEARIRQDYPGFDQA